MHWSRMRTRGLALAAAGTFAAALMVSPGAAQAAPAPGTSTVVVTSSAHRAMVRDLRRQVVEMALTRIGAEYVTAGVGPDQFDCSGLVMWVYQQVTGTVLPHYSGAQMDVATPLDPLAKLRRGDLLFYGPDGSQHVAIYMGHGMQIGANNPRSGIVVEPMSSSYWTERYAGAGRIIQ